MSSLILTLTVEDLKRLDERADAIGGSRESVALAAIRARLDEPIPEPEPESEPEAEAPQPARRRGRNFSSFTELPVEGEEKE